MALSVTPNSTTNVRKVGQNELSKNLYCKLKNNSGFDKTMENVRDQTEVICCFDDERQKHLQSKTDFLRPRHII